MTETRAIVTDIEGTTTSIAFVKDTLFPYARKRLPAFVETHADDQDVRHWLHEAARIGGLTEARRTEVIDLLIEWMDADRKVTPLKALQGMIWKEGYETGEFTSDIYADVPDALRGWHADGVRLYVYSSGSVAAQKLMFTYSDAGDLTPLFAGHFDTEIGHKREAESYAAIAEAIDETPAHILFLSDVTEELDAAAAAGLRTTLVCRPPASCPSAPGTHPCVESFAAIDI